MLIKIWQNLLNLESGLHVTDPSFIAFSLTIEKVRYHKSGVDKL